MYEATHYRSVCMNVLSGRQFGYLHEGFQFSAGLKIDQIDLVQDTLLPSLG